MEQREPQHLEIISFVKDVARRFSEDAAGKIGLKCVFLGGSLAFYMREVGRHAPSWRTVPDANVYAVIDGTEGDILRGGALMFNAIEALSAERAASGKAINVSIDVHPFAFAGNPEIVRQDALNLQITTRILNVNSVYGQHCWNAWLDNFVVLEESELNYMATLAGRKRMPRDIAWLRDMYLALLTYTNALLVLPLYTSRPGTIFDEAYRYFKEISKDGVGIGLTDEEFANGRLYELLFGGDKSAVVAFYRERYGEEAERLMNALHEVDADYHGRRGAGGGLELAAQAIRLKEIVLRDGFLPQLAAFRARNESTLDALAVQPLWF